MTKLSSPMRQSMTGALWNSVRVTMPTGKSDLSRSIGMPEIQKPFGPVTGDDQRILPLGNVDKRVRRVADRVRHGSLQGFGTVFCGKQKPLVRAKPERGLIRTFGCGKRLLRQVETERFGGRVLSGLGAPEREAAERRGLQDGDGG